MSSTVSSSSSAAHTASVSPSSASTQSRSALPSLSRSGTVIASTSPSPSNSSVTLAGVTSPLPLPGACYLAEPCAVEVDGQIVGALTQVSGLAVEIAYGGARAPDCTLSLALSYFDAADGASAWVSAWVNASTPVAAAWYVKTLANGWTALVKLPLSDTLITGGVVVEVSVADGAGGFASYPPVSVVAPSSSNCALQLPTPILTVAESILGLDIAVGLEPPIGTLLLPATLGAAGSTVTLVTLGGSGAGPPGSVSFTWAGDAVALNFSLPLACASIVSVFASVTKPGALSSGTAVAASTAAAAECVAIESLVATSASPSVRLTLSGGRTAPPSCAVLVSVELLNATTYVAGAPASDGQLQAAPPLMQPTVLRLVRVDAGGSVDSSFAPLTFAALSPSRLTLNLGDVEAGSLIQLQTTSGTDGAWVAIGEPVAAPASCTTSAVSACSSDTFVACGGAAIAGGSPCALSYQLCWPGSNSAFQATPAATGCRDGVFVALSDPACAIGARGGGSGGAANASSGVGGAPGTAPPGCNPQTWIRCTIDDAEAALRAASVAPSPCTQSFAQCWPGAPSVLQSNPAGVGCLDGNWLSLSSAECAAQKSGRQLRASPPARLEAPRPPGLPYRRSARSAAVTTTMSAAACRGSAGDSGGCAFCPTPCGREVGWLVNGQEFVSAAPAGAVCVPNATDGTIALMPSILDGTSPALGACSPLLAAQPPCPAAGGAVCIDADGALGSAGVCTSAYYVCDASGVATFGAPLPAGTACLDGRAVLADGPLCVTPDESVSVNNGVRMNVSLTLAGCGGTGGVSPAMVATLSAAFQSLLVAAGAPANTSVTVVGGSASSALAPQTPPGPPLPGVPILAAAPLGVGVASVTLVVSSAAASDVAVVDGALAAALTPDPATGVSPASAAIGAAGFSVVVSAPSGTSATATSPPGERSSPSGQSGSESSTLPLARTTLEAMGAGAVAILASLIVYTVVARLRRQRSRKIAPEPLKLAHMPEPPPVAGALLSPTAVALELQPGTDLLPLDDGSDPFLLG